MTGDPREVLTRAAPPPSSTHAWGDGPDDVWELYEPSAEVARGVTVALVHGGFWRAAFDRTHLRPLASALAAQGFSVTSLEFPRVGMPRGGWPGTFTSVVAGLRAVHDWAASRGAGPVVAVGHSAGGHLAVLAVSGDDPAPLAGVVSLAGVLDLHRAHADRLGDGAAEELMGGPPGDGPEAWVAADPARQRHHAPVVLIHGADDDRVPVAQSESWVRSRGEGGPAAYELVVLPGIEHFLLIDPLAAPFPRLLAAIQQLATR